MKIRPVSEAIEGYMNRASHARGSESRNVLVTSRNAFGPAGANYEVDDAGKAVHELPAPGDDFDTGDEVVKQRIGDQGSTVTLTQLGDPTRRPTQAPQYDREDVTGVDCL